MKGKSTLKHIAVFSAVAILLTAILVFSAFSFTRTSAIAETSASTALELNNKSFTGSDGNCVSTYFPNGYINVKKNASAEGVNNTWSFHDTAISMPAYDYSDYTQIWIELALISGANANGANWWDQITIATVDTGGDIAHYAKRADSSKTEGNSVGTLRASTLGGETSAGYTQNAYTRFWSNSVGYYILDLANKTDVATGNWFEFYNQNKHTGATSDASFTKKDLAGVIFRTHNDNNGRNEYNYGAIYGKKSDGTFVRLFSPAHATVVATSVEGKATWNTTANCVMENPNIQASGTQVNAWYDLSIKEGNYTITSKPSNNWSNWWGRWTIPTDVSAYNGVSYYVDNTTSNTAIHVDLYLQTTNPTANVFFNSGKAYFYPDADCTAVTEPTFSTAYAVPKGFKGTVVIPFSSNNSSAVNLASTKGTLGINMMVDGATYKTGSFVLRDVKFVKDAKVKISVTSTVQKTDGTFQTITYQKDAIAGTNYENDFDEISSRLTGIAQASEYTYSLVSATSTQSGKVSGWGNVNGELVVNEKYEVTSFLNDPFTLPATINLGAPQMTNSGQVSVSGDTFTVVKSSSSAWTGVTFSAFPSNLSRYNGISYYVDLSNNTQDIFFNKYLTEGKTGTRVDGTENYKEVWYSNYGAAMYYPDEGTTFYQTNGAEYSGHVNQIPAGFKGTIVVPFASFNNDWSQVDKIFDLSNIASVALTFERSVGGGTFTLKDFKLVSDAKVYISGSAYIQKRDGAYGESRAISSLSGTRQSVLAGSAWTPTAEIEIDGVKFVIDESKSTYDPNNIASYGTDANWRKNVIVGTENRTDEYQYWGMGNAIWRYAPTVYYKYKDAFEVEKVFGLGEIQTEFKKGTTTAEILSQFPEDAVSVGNSHGGFTQLNGEWRITDNGGGNYTVQFALGPGALAVIDPSGLLTYEITVSQLDPVVTQILVTAPLKKTYGKGESLELAGVVVTAIYDDGTTETISVDDYLLSGYDKNALGEQTITVTYENHTATFKVTVVDAVTEDEPSGSNGAPVSGDGGCSASTVASVAGILGTLLALFVIKRRV